MSLRKLHLSKVESAQKDMIYSLKGDIDDIPRRNELPEFIQYLVHHFKDTFASKLNEGKMMNCQPIKVKIDTT